MPVTWVPDLLGWPEDGRDRLVEWAAANFDALGPLNARGEAAGAGILEMAPTRTRSPRPSCRRHLRRTDPDAAARGEVEAGPCPMMIIDYLAPSLDTTISAIGNAVWLFATHPEQWQAPA